MLGIIGSRSARPAVRSRGAACRGTGADRAVDGPDRPRRVERDGRPPAGGSGRGRGVGARHGDPRCAGPRRPPTGVGGRPPSRDGRARWRVVSSGRSNGRVRRPQRRRHRRARRRGVDHRQGARRLPTAAGRVGRGGGGSAGRLAGRRARPSWPACSPAWPTTSARCARERRPVGSRSSPASVPGSAGRPRWRSRATAATSSSRPGGPSTWTRSSLELEAIGAPCRGGADRHR